MYVFTLYVICTMNAKTVGYLQPLFLLQVFLFCFLHLCI